MSHREDAVQIASLLRSKVSKSWAAATVGASPASAPQPAFRSTSQAHPYPNPQQQGAAFPFAARAALDPDNPQASLDMFRRLSSSRRERVNEGGRRPDRRARPASSAHRAERDVSSPTGQESLLELLEEGWTGLHPPHQEAAAVPPQAPEQPAAPREFPQPPRAGHTPSSAPSPVPSIEPPLLHLSPDTSRSSQDQPHPQKAIPSSPHATSVEVSAISVCSFVTADTSFTTARRAERHSSGIEEEGAAMLECDTPRSAVSCTSYMSSVATLPQTEAELQQLDMHEVERLASEAAVVRARATTTLHLARQRLNAGSGDAFRCYMPGAAPGTSAKAPQPLGHRSIGHGQKEAAGQSSPAGAQRVVQLYLLLLAVAETALLWGADIMQRASLGVLHPPQDLVLAPVRAVRGGICMILLLTDLVLQALGLLAPAPGRMRA